jgi:hypothetical protein
MDKRIKEGVQYNKRKRMDNKRKRTDSKMSLHLDEQLVFFNE